MDKRVVVSGIGVVSSLGNNSQEVLHSLANCISGIEAVPEWNEYGFKSSIAGTIKLPDSDELRRQHGPKARFMGVSALYSIIAAEEAIFESGLDKEEISNSRTACIAGSGFSNAQPMSLASKRVDGTKRKIGPFEVTRSMASSVSANLTNYFEMQGRSYSISSACATSLHNIGHAYELIRDGNCSIALAGGAEEISPMYTSMFDGMRIVLSSAYNDRPEAASRAFDQDRDGFVISGGAGMVVLEEYERAKSRNAPIYGEILGFGTSTDGFDIVQPEPMGHGCYRCMKEALMSAGCAASDIDYVNAHGTSTPAGDLAEGRAIGRLFGKNPVRISSSKSLAGHGIGATGAQELIYSLIMLKNQFMTGSINIDNLEYELADLNILRENEFSEFDTLITNTFGFGGTNGSLVVRKH